MPRQPMCEIVSLREDSPGALWEQVLAIEDESFPGPWTRQAFTDELAHSSSFIDLLCERGKKVRVVGFLCCRQLCDEMHLLQIAVHPAFRKQGHAAHLLAHLLTTALARDCCRLVLEVRRGNLLAINLYEKHGFQRVGLRKAYYADGEDAVVMTCEIFMPPALL